MKKLLPVVLSGLFLLGCTASEEATTEGNVSDEAKSQPAKSVSMLCEGKVPQAAEDFTTTDSGLKYQDLRVGTGPMAEAGEVLTVNYIGTLEDGTQFDSSCDRGEPFSFQLGAGEVIKGWDEGVKGMKVGGIRKLVIPAELGYGSRPVGSIPANSTLFFEVEFFGIAED